MAEESRKYSEIAAMAEFEPGLRNIFVEGASDFFLLRDFIAHHNMSDYAVYTIDEVDFSELYEGLEPSRVIECKDSNKERVILLSQVLERDFRGTGLPWLCIVDIDWDNVLNNIHTGSYLTYTDYNSMDMYLCNEAVVTKYLHQGHRIKTVKTTALMDSIAEVGRQVFHIHCLMHENKKSIVDNNKDFQFDKDSQRCSLDVDSFWQKTLTKNGLVARSGELRAVFDSRMAAPYGAKMEVRGHDFVYYLYLCTKKLKPKMSMSDEEFANIFWQYADLDALAQEPMFQRIMGLA